MLKSIHIENFRSFRNLPFGPLARVNLISGKNNIGKSSLLEAIYLNARNGSHETLTELHRFRGVSGTKSGAESNFRWFFFDELVSQPAIITGRTDRGLDQTVKIEFAQTESGFEPRFDFQSNDRSSVTVIARDFLDASTAMTGSLRGTRCLLIGHRMQDQQRDLEFFSQLRATGSHVPIVESLRSIEKRLDELEILVIEGGPEMYANLNGQVKLLPLCIVGDGFRHLLSIVTAVACCRNGVALIDEVENGFHFSVLPQVWTAISKAAEAANVQVFATTHSRECVEAAYQVYQGKNDDEFRAHRLERNPNGEIKAITYDRESLGASLEQGWEVR